MTGPEHYRAAEERRSTAVRDYSVGNYEEGDRNLRLAAVHATLANAAALVDATNEGVSDLAEWRAVQARVRSSGDDLEPTALLTPEAAREVLLAEVGFPPDRASQLARGGTS